MLGVLTAVFVGQSWWGYKYTSSPYSLIWFGATSTAQDGEYFIYGYAHDDNSRIADIALKIKSDGSVEWAKVTGERGDNGFLAGPTRIASASDGGIVFGGKGLSSSNDRYFRVTKLSATGALEWSRVFGRTDYGRPEDASVVRTNDGGYMVAGVVENASVDEVLIIFKMSSSGSFVSGRVFTQVDDNLVGIVSALAPTSDGGCILAWATDKYGAGDDDFIVLKLNSSGSAQWIRTFGGSTVEYAYAALQTSDGGYVIGGVTESFGAGSRDGFIIRLNSSGNLVWARTVGTSQTEGGIYAIAQTSDGGFLCGMASSILFKVSSSGSLEWAKKCPSTPNGIFIDGDTALVVMSATSFFKMPLTGDMPCLTDTLLSVNAPSISTSTVSTSSTSWSPDIENVVPPLYYRNLDTADICPPVALEEIGYSIPSTAITCSPFSGGVLFSASQATNIRVYSVSGRLVYCDLLKQGENKIFLDPGVYLWEAGTQKGKAVVR